MKKYNLFLVVFLLSFTLLGFNVNSASAQTSGSGGGGGSSSLPAGCASTQGYSPITGVKCDTIVLEYLPEGCTSTFGYSPTTGIKCDNGIYTSLPVGCTSTVGYSPVTGERCDSLTFPPGCNSNQGYSITTGRPCNNGAIFPPGCASNTGFSSTTGQSCGSNSNPTITVLSPNGGEQIKKGDTYRIKWESKDVSQVYIKLRKGNGTYQGNEREISRPIYNQGYFDWKVPTTIPDGNDYGIALVQEGGNRFDISDSHFTITTSSTQPSINLQVNGSDFPSAVEYGSVIEASWGSTGIDISKTECKMGGHYVPTIDGWLWNDQTNQKPNGVVKLYARHATLGYISPLSLTITCFDGIKNYYDNVSITVKQPTTSTPSITVLSPNGGENYKVGDVVPIRWSSSGLQSGARFGIQLSYRNSGETSNIEDSMVTSIVGNTYNWTIPATYGTGKRSDLFMVRVMAFETGMSPAPQDYSDSFFTIATATTTTAVSCTDSDGGQNPNVLGIADGRANGIGSYFTDASVASNGGVCSGDSCTSVAEGYCTSAGQVSNILMSCSTGYSVNGACAAVPTSARITYDVKTDKSTYTSSESIQIYITATNNTSEVKILNWSNGCQTSYAVANYDSSVGQMCTQNQTSVSIAPGASKTWTITHNPAVYRIPAGQYKLSGKVLGFGGADILITISDTQPTASIVLTSANENKTGTAGVYTSGSFNNNPNDWKWTLNLNMNGNTKTIFSIKITGAGAMQGDIWTTNTSNWPVVVFRNGEQLNTRMGQTFSVGPNTETLYLYGQQSAKTTWGGGTLTVTFTDGTSVSSAIPSPATASLSSSVLGLPAGSLTASAIGATTDAQVSGNIASASKFRFTQFLEQGSYGNEVRELQKLLNKAGYDAGNVDGVLGAKVKAALMEFQTDNKLKVDGLVGYEVRTFLNR